MSYFKVTCQRKFLLLWQLEDKVIVLQGRKYREQLSWKSKDIPVNSEPKPGVKNSKYRVKCLSYWTLLIMHSNWTIFVCIWDSLWDTCMWLNGLYWRSVIISKHMYGIIFNRPMLKDIPVKQCRWWDLCRPQVVSTLHT